MLQLVNSGDLPDVRTINDTVQKRIGHDDAGADGLESYKTISLDSFIFPKLVEGTSQLHVVWLSVVFGDARAIFACTFLPIKIHTCKVSKGTRIA